MAPAMTPDPSPPPRDRALEAGCFRILFENSSDPHLVFDGEGIVDCNLAAVRLLGAGSREEVLDLHPGELSPERQPDGALSLERAAEMDARARREGVHRFEWTHQAKDGTPLPVHVTLNPVQHGERELMVAVWHDLRDLKEREAQLLRATDELRRLNGELQRANETMHRSLRAAAEVQEALLPPERIEVPGLEVEWVWRPSSHVGGDALSCFRLGGGRTGFFLLDVSGHGVAAALWAVAVSQLLLPGRETSIVQPAGAGEPRPPQEVVRLLNEHLAGSPGQTRFLTLFYGVFCPRTGELAYVAAGHGGAYLARQRRPPEHLRATNIPVGISAGLTFAQRRLHLRPQDRLFVFSDGIPEARRSDGVAFGWERLAAAIEGGGAQPLSDLARGIESATMGWCGRPGPHDDVSLIALERRGVGL